MRIAHKSAGSRLLISLECHHHVQAPDSLDLNDRQALRLK
jgi:hypothetical protein